MTLTIATLGDHLAAQGVETAVPVLSAVGGRTIYLASRTERRHVVVFGPTSDAP